MRLAMSVLDGFVRIRLYRKQAAEFQWLADNAQILVCGDVTAVSRAVVAIWQAAKSKPIIRRMAERLEQIRREPQETWVGMARKRPGPAVPSRQPVHFEVDQRT
jgi:hypothetical protein